MRRGCNRHVWAPSTAPTNLLNLVDANFFADLAGQPMSASGHSANELHTRSESPVPARSTAVSC